VQTNIERWWTNRDEELAILARMVRGALPQRILAIRASAGYGKSWLIDRMQDWCAQEGIPCARMDFDRSREGATLSAELILEKTVERLRQTVPIEQEMVMRLIVDWRGGAAQIAVAEEAEFKETGWYGDVANIIGSLGVAVILDISGHAPCDFAAK